MLYSNYLALLALGSAAAAGSPRCTVPAVQPKQAVALDPSPVGVSFEFFMWPSYMTNISLALPCMNHFDKLYGKKMPIRIGGTTQDRATYDPNFDGYVSYTTDDPLVAPMSLAYGPKFFDLIRLNRGLNNRTNTFAAAQEVKARALKNLWAIELGNEPDLFYKFWKYPVATAPWNETQEGANAADWAQDFIKHWKNPLPILAGGGYAVPLELEPGWPNLPHLIDTAYNKTVKDATKVYNGHLYALSNTTGDDLNLEMRHERTVADLSLLPVSSAKSVNRPFILGETGFHGADYEMDATFGSAIQTVDKTLRALTLGIQRLFYHQGTINQAQRCIYGAYFGALAVEGGDSISAADNGNDAYAQYVVYRKGKPHKIVLVNTDYYSGTGKRSATTFTLTGLKSGCVEALRMTAPSSETMIPVKQTKPSLEPSIGGQYFSNDNCSLRGGRESEKVCVRKGRMAVSLKASEALIIYL